MERAGTDHCHTTEKGCEENASGAACHQQATHIGDVSVVTFKSVMSRRNTDGLEISHTEMGALTNHLLF